MNMPVDRPRNITWTGPNQEAGRIEFKWGDADNPVPRGVRFHVKTTDGRELRYEEEGQYASHDECQRQAIDTLRDMMRSLET
ncbi:hypothetical protein NAG83_24135 [Pseudomonas carnis]|uniref:hypothetical protein n=1 Tax=Pseudomonas carnis TaxID=2487355 RepID=UPI002095AC2F|nr:hypothetical protein [Pseudomonas carnis]MCO7039598.1 hypothetical protein [Pseudomonas carnis]